MAPRVRLARPEEHEAVAACVRAAYSRYVGRIGKEPAPMLADYEALIRRGVVYVLADEGISGVLVMEQVGEAVFVENVAVLPSNQRSGLGRRLMRFAEEFARERGLSEILLYTNERMTENIAFYKGLGFREVDRRLEDGYRRVYLNKNLSEDA